MSVLRKTQLTRVQRQCTISCMIYLSVDITHEIREGPNLDFAIMDEEFPFKYGLILNFGRLEIWPSIG